MALLLLLLTLLLIAAGHRVDSYASKLTCDKSLTVGTTIMISASTASTARTVVLKRSGTTLTSGSSTYVAGETLQVSLSTTGNQYVFESNQAIFTSSGSCSNKRLVKDGTTTSFSVVMPTDGSTVTIWAGFAASKTAVQITDTVSFAAALSPTAAPTPAARAPSAAPSTTKPTVPISSSTEAQTLLTYSLEVRLANITKTSALINSELLRSAMKSSYSTFYQPYNVSIADVRNSSEVRRLLLDASTTTTIDFSLDFILEATTYTSEEDFTSALNVVSELVIDGGILVSKLDATGVVTLAGVTSAALLTQSLSSTVVYGTYAPTDAPTQVPASVVADQDDSPLRAAVAVALSLSTAVSAVIFCIVRKKRDSALLITSTYAVAVAALAVALVNLWAVDSSSTLDTGFLGVPTAENLFAYHPQIMISCFFLFQILAISSWSVFSSYLVGKIGHVACNTAALVSMAFGLGSIVKYSVKVGSAGFVSLHSWVGLLCAVVFCLNFLYGMGMGMAKMLTSGDPEGSLSSSVKRIGPQLKLHHKFFGAFALFLTALSIVTGIVLKTDGQCAYIDASAQISVTEDMNSNPGSHYPHLPLSCKVSGGCGVAVVISAALVFLLALYRNAVHEDYWTPQVAFAPSAPKLYDSGDVALKTLKPKSGKECPL